MSDEEIWDRATEQPSKSLAQMLKSQYTSREFFDTYASTEFEKKEIIPLCKAFSIRFVTQILATSDDSQLLENTKGEELTNLRERLAIRKAILYDDNAMAFAMIDSFLYAFGLTRQSLGRQSRKEAIQIAMGQSGAPVEDLGFKDRLFSKLGISKKYKTGYFEKE